MSRRSRASSALLLVSVGALAAACATSDQSGKAVTYSLTAKQNYEKGLAELKDENHPEALKYFSFVKQKFPFSKYAALAELAIADTNFDRGSYPEAVDDYKAFIRLHPTHEKVEDGYAAFKVAECYRKQMPEDWFLVPPAAEKDQSAVRDALRELDDFIEKYPDSKHVVAGQAARKEVMRRLVDHEVYVARFYLDRQKPRAAALRLEGALRRYPGSGREPELLLALGQTHLTMGSPLRAKETFGRIISDYGSAYQARRAELYLAFIRKRWGEKPQDKPALDALPEAPPSGREVDPEI